FDALSFCGPGGRQSDRTGEDPAAEQRQCGRFGDWCGPRGLADIVSDSSNLDALVPPTTRGKTHLLLEAIDRYRRKSVDDCGPKDRRSRGVDPSKVDNTRAVGWKCVRGREPDVLNKTGPARWAGARTGYVAVEIVNRNEPARCQIQRVNRVYQRNNAAIDILVSRHCEVVCPEEIWPKMSRAGGGGDNVGHCDGSKRQRQQAKH